jgi:tetratricopeptide (TPR) repeat protein
MPQRLLALSILVAGLSALATAAATAGAGHTQTAEATSLLGRKLASPALTPESQARMEAQLATAMTDWDKNRDDVDALIWVGRRTAYLGRFRDAIALYSEGIKGHPADPRLYRHRGHRYLTVREIDLAIADFEKAVTLITAAGASPDAIEPDGQPNARNTPTSTLHSYIYYHLGLGYYLNRDYGRAADAFRRARDVVRNADNLVAASNWLYLSLRRGGQAEAAAAVLLPIDARHDVIENGSYHSLLLMYKGERTPDEVLKAAGEGSAGTAVRYGVSAWYLINGKRREAQQLWAQILDGADWPSFGHLAAEAEAR